jgi:hypothetical protein
MKAFSCSIAKGVTMPENDELSGCDELPFSDSTLSAILRHKSLDGID